MNATGEQGWSGGIAPGHASKRHQHGDRIVSDSGRIGEEDFAQLFDGPRFFHCHIDEKPERGEIL